MEEILESLSAGFPAPSSEAKTDSSSAAGTSSATDSGSAADTSSATDSSSIAGSSKKKPALLLHACCGPCSSYCLETLVPYFDITIYYYNPNISPQQEYSRRLSELTKFLARFPPAISGSVKLVEAEYNPEDFYNATKVRNEPELAAEEERGERCRRCYNLRMSRAYEYACKNGFDWFTTTLSISPHKDAEKINIIGFALEAAAKKEADSKQEESGPKGYTRFLPSDFKKKNGFLRSTQISQEYGMWRQDYCGCPYSFRKKAEDTHNS
ncbi:MAG: epoxyqueuosine reductase QueH [Treponemataceae bacterium]|nr:epoxyqueuosine reductase QueH [Treponemataceae bacterium]